MDWSGEIHEFVANRKDEQKVVRAKALLMKDEEFNEWLQKQWEEDKKTKVEYPKGMKAAPYMWCSQFQEAVRTRTFTAPHEVYAAYVAEQERTYKERDIKINAIQEKMRQRMLRTGEVWDDTHKMIKIGTIVRVNLARINTIEGCEDIMERSKMDDDGGGNWSGGRHFFRVSALEKGKVSSWADVRYRVTPVNNMRGAPWRDPCLVKLYKAITKKQWGRFELRPLMKYRTGMVVRIDLDRSHTVRKLRSAAKKGVTVATLKIGKRAHRFSFSMWEVGGTVEHEDGEDRVILKEKPLFDGSRIHKEYAFETEEIKTRRVDEHGTTVPVEFHEQDLFEVDANTAQQMRTPKGQQEYLDMLHQRAILNTVDRNRIKKSRRARDAQMQENEREVSQYPEDLASNVRLRTMAQYVFEINEGE